MSDADGKSAPMQTLNRWEISAIANFIEWQGRDHGVIDSLTNDLELYRRTYAKPKTADINVHRIHKGSPDEVLEGAVGEFSAVLVLGYNEDGGLEARSDSGTCAREISWMLTNFHTRMIMGEYRPEG